MGSGAAPLAADRRTRVSWFTSWYRPFHFLWPTFCLSSPNFLVSSWSTSSSKSRSFLCLTSWFTSCFRSGCLFGEPAGPVPDVLTLPYFLPLFLVALLVYFLVHILVYFLVITVNQNAQSTVFPLLAPPTGSYLARTLYEPGDPHATAIQFK